MMKILPGGFFDSYQTSYQGRIREFELRIECEYDLEKRKDIAKDILNGVHANVHCLLFRIYYENFESETPLDFNESLEKVGYPPNYYEAQKRVDRIEGYHDEELCKFLDRFNELTNKFKKGIDIDETLDETELEEFTMMLRHYEELYEQIANKSHVTEIVMEKMRTIRELQKNDDYFGYHGVIAWFYFEKEFYDYVEKRYNELKDTTPENLTKVLIVNQEDAPSQYQANPPSPPPPSQTIAKGKMTWNTDVKYLVNLFNSLRDKILDGTPLLEATDEAIMYFIIHKFLNKHSKPFDVADLQKYFDGHTTPKNQKIRWNGEIVELCYIFRELYKPLEKGSTIYLSTKKETLKDNIHEYFVWKANDQEMKKGTLDRNLTPGALRKIKRKNKHSVNTLMGIST